MYIPAFRGEDLEIFQMYVNGESAYILWLGKSFSIISASEFMLKMNELEGIDNQEQ
jgi:hypothetical protein